MGSIASGRLVNRRVPAAFVGTRQIINRKFFDGSSQRLSEEYPLGRLRTAIEVESFSEGQLWAANYWAITRGRRHVDPSRSALWDNLDCDILRYYTPLVAHQMYVPAAYVGEALACCIDFGRAGGVGGLVNCERSRYDGDQAGTRMRVPPSVSPDWERVLGDIEI